MNSSEKLLRKEEELALTDHLIVPSEFVRRTLSKADSLRASINVVPYGAPATTFDSKVKRSMPGKLKVIFVGALTQRKGLSYLLRAIERLGSRVELTIVGKKVANCSVLDRALAAHRWIPSLPHRLVLEEISRQDVMVFPSLFEGFGLVILEAMAAGVPVVTTSNGGGPELISDGEDGFIVPIRDVEAIAERLELLLHDPERLSAMSHAALLKTRQHTWSSYRQRLAGVVQQAVTRNARDSSLPYSDPACLRACNSC
jgi:glycosyltransferase involved in cell wall biosynthesis